ncbi:MAG: hypothetical protein K0S46_1265 [Moraxellaceae bacterium]|jgi:AraC-like DNA-binding protein|nr:hypothetical protein [Moraxellaceae bacterium]
MKKRTGQDVFVPLFLLQIPQKSLARFGLSQKEWVELLRVLLQVDVQAEPPAETLICLRDFSRVFRVARNLFGPEQFLLAYLTDIRPWHLGAVGRAMEVAPTLDDSLSLWAGNADLLAPMLDIAPRDTDTARGFEIRLTADLGEITETYMELILLMTVALLRDVSGQPLAAELRFAHERRLPAAFYRDSFGLEPGFGHRHYGLALARDDTARANGHHAPLLYREARQGLQALRTAAAAQARLSFLVRKHLSLAADDGLFPGMEEVALHFNMSERTFARRLQEEDVTFRDLRSQVQDDIARRLLRKPSLALRTIAERAGHPGVAAFCRAFEAANGVTPEAYRATANGTTD